MKQSIITALLGLCLSATAFADTTMYKWVDKEGVVSYSQMPPSAAGAHNVTNITIDTLPVEQRRAANRMLSNLDSNDDAKFKAYQNKSNEADQRIDAAITNLSNAEHRLTHDSVPNGNDRIGNGGESGNHHARLSQAYFSRVSQLQANVEQAKKDLQDAYNSRDNIVP